jgi:hypothetical protein
MVTPSCDTPAPPKFREIISSPKVCFCNTQKEASTSLTLHANDTAHTTGPPVVSSRCTVLYQKFRRLLTVGGGQQVTPKYPPPTVHLTSWGVSTTRHASETAHRYVTSCLMHHVAHDIHIHTLHMKPAPPCMNPLLRIISYRGYTRGHTAHSCATSLTRYIHMLWPALFCNLSLCIISYTVGCRGQPAPSYTKSLTTFISIRSTSLPRPLACRTLRFVLYHIRACVEATLYPFLLHHVAHNVYICMP